MYIVTGADWSHARSLLQLISSIRKHEPEMRIVTYDLGLTSQQRVAIEAALPTGCEVIAFPYDRYPEYFDISRAAGEYAWKPTIVGLEMAKSDAPLCWMDAGNLLIKPLRQVRWVTAHRGLFARSSSGDIPDWTHPSTLAWFGLPPGWGRGFRNLSAACVAFDPLNPAARRLVDEWARCAGIHECIAPPGSSRLNHRQDQALLSVLAYRSGLIRRPDTRWFWRGMEFHTHRDLPPEPELLAERNAPESMGGLLKSNREA
jgi:hypothetical protein